MKHPKKHLTVHTAPAYPNAADRNYYNRRLLDIITGGVSCAGFILAMLFLITFI